MADKNYMPFDALNGFRETLRKREKQIIDRKDVTFAPEEELERALAALAPGIKVVIIYTRGGEFIRLRGTVEQVSRREKCLRAAGARVDFGDIVDITI